MQPDTDDAAPVPDLMSALKASLEAVQKRPGDEPTQPGKAKPKAPRKRAASAPKRKAAAKSG